MAALVPEATERYCVGQIAIKRRLPVRKRLRSTRELQTRRSPVDRRLIVTLNPRVRRDILAILEVRSGPSRQARKLIADDDRESRGKCVPPVYAGGDTVRIRRIHILKNIRS